MKPFCFLTLVAVMALSFSAPTDGAERPKPPNVVIVFADDLGYGDLGCYGAPGRPTPNLDRMAAEGVRFTDFYVAQAICSASRTALLTGRYPNRVGILSALGPEAKGGIADGEATIAEVLKSRGYATAIYGKWHLGHRSQFLPKRHGFDDYFGLPYSNDMWPKHPTNRSFPDLPLIEGDTVVEHNPDQTRLTRWYTERAVRFITEHKDEPFFVYVPHAMPHVPLHVSERFRGKSERGLYGDVLLEIDWSVGEILATLKKSGVDDRTLVIFSSDNGPWLSYGTHAGSAGPLREGKATTFDGGVRVPFVARWPGHIPAGSVVHEPAMTIDVLPTLAAIADATLPTGQVIDGKDISSLLLGRPGARSPHEALYFFWERQLQAVRSGRWKLHFPHEYRTLAGRHAEGGEPVEYEQRKIGLSLFDLDKDPGETTDVAAQHPDVVRHLEQLADVARDDLGDMPTGRPAGGARPPAR